MNDKEMLTRDSLATAMVKNDRLRKVSPGVNIYENQDEILLQVEMPGVAKEGITIDLDNGKLTLAGSRKGINDGVALYTEFGPVEFRRAFSVPQSINSDKVHADFCDGVLNLHLPKSEAFKPRTIEVK
ncbi:MAG: Hsp20/alpha crystallin family protein [Desulfobulbaceae bacterium]|nr:Hsp20/alpha crystallin family protein [Desulfobulbaceae bacterium]